MGLIRNSIVGYRRKGWGLGESFAYFAKGVSRELGILPGVFTKFHKAYVEERKSREWSCHTELELPLFRARWLRELDGESYFDFGMCCLADVSGSESHLKSLRDVFEDTFMFPCFLGDDYDSYVVRYFDSKMAEGPYGYRDGLFDVTVKAEDIVIDAGAWIGDFSAYACSKGALCYAFEPVKETYRLLEKTKELNIKLSKFNGGGVKWSLCAVA